MNAVEKSKTVNKLKKELSDTLLSVDIEVKEEELKIQKIFVEYRRTLNVSQTEMAEKMDISQKTVSNIENGIHKLTYREIKSLLRILSENEDRFDFTN